MSDRKSILDEEFDKHKPPTVREILREVVSNQEIEKSNYKVIQQNQEEILKRLESVETFRNDAFKIGKWLVTALGFIALFFITGARDWIVEHWTKIFK